MKLVDPKDLLKASESLGWFGGESFAKLLMYILRLNKLNDLYSANCEKTGVEFINGLIDDLGIKFEFDEEELKRIPLDGSFISVSNHPFGGIDGILLIKLLSDIRPDFKVMANFILQKIEPLKDCFLGVNPFEDRKAVASSMGGIKEALRHMSDGSPLGIFPAGEVSAYQSESKNITDKQWQPSILKLIKKAEVPVIPIHFQGSNSLIFYLMGMIHPILRTVKLPSELLNKKNKTIRIRIGNPISLKDQKGFTDINQYGRFLRAKTYMLGSAVEVKKFYENKSSSKKKKAVDIIPAVDVNLISKEIEGLSEFLLFKAKNFSVYCAPSDDIPNLLIELGRLREITFREVGEGTNHSIDVDEYDLYYHQLFIWDEENKKIVGAYRVGKGKEILDKYGLKGFYLQSLFKMQKAFQPVLSESIELGRSFIVKEYQRKPMPLFLLWKGIMYFLLKNPECRYLIGPVSISNDYSNSSKDLIIKFIMRNYFDYDMGQFIKSRKKFKVKVKGLDMDILLEAAKNDINKLDKLIGDFEVSNAKLPVLLKKYISLNAKIVGFNIDPNFNDCLDGLIVVDLFDVPVKMIESLTKEINNEEVTSRFVTREEKN
ncbi:lysophospholipid acyltransferase family protein [Ancylomarina sp. 16SWW S1-10-2]|uniref:lysophospholipid acyltransferase family protein n=1 Tax=Ancylomarina sp. 16SWW S1-10-2 TaxID=2499681 RepID=UPI0012ADEBE6|nr:lysophospholipid acyltransferase family protein [Ancylomarina sp. 16SWW S1-10-2]MRT94125.1 lysophospholipid acyltransferase family protein [Ancylomarina sp. 16SWW S1-10-2]